jgi:hypothetical protein
MSLPTDAFELGIALAQALEGHGVEYALGGALAYGQYGIPRATNDVDVNVFVAPDGLAPVFEALRALDVPVDEAAARAAAQDEGLFVVRLGGYRIDVFTPSIDFSWEAARTRVRHEVEGARVWFLSAEALAVFKLLFFRAKDLVDLERLIAVQGGAVDVAYVRARIVEMLGEEDPRVEAWDRLCAENMPEDSATD